MSNSLWADNKQGAVSPAVSRETETVSGWTTGVHTRFVSQQNDCVHGLCVRALLRYTHIALITANWWR